MKTVVLILIILFNNSIAHELYLLNNSDTLDNKGYGASDTLLVTSKDSTRNKDSLISHQTISKPLLIESIPFDINNSYSNKIKYNEYSLEDYRNLSDIFTYMPFGFVQDLGSLGQPNEQMFYGLGFSNISYNRDGVLLNNRWQNSYDLNKLNNERIDSLEIVPLTRGFLYGTYNNPVSINLHSRFNYSTQAITRLKFYQASYDEGFVDVLFHTPITNKLNFGVGVSNSAIDSRFNNSDYESWKLDAKVAYLVNDKINIIANYFYTYDTLALFGGLDTSLSVNDDFSTVLYEYDRFKRQSYRYQLTYNNNASLKILTTFIPNSKTDLTIYYNSTSQKFNQNIDTLDLNLPVIVNDNYFQTFGIRFQNYYESNNLSFDLVANYETTSMDFNYSSNIQRDNIISLSGKLSNSISKLFVPSIFGKGIVFNGDILLGYGLDITGEINNSVTYYFGVSRFQKQKSFLENTRYPSLPFNLIASSSEPSENRVVEVGIKYNSSLISGGISYFNYSSKNSLIPYTNGISNDTLLINELYYFNRENINNSGINISFNIKLWKLLFSNSFNYFISSRTERVYASPDYTLAGKLYYLDKLFNNNLDVKAGINYRFTGGQTPFVYDFEKLLQITSELTTMVQYIDVPPSFQLDLYMAGTIQERATIFVTLENLLNTDYYIAPHYFKQTINLRLGVSWLLLD